MERGPGVTRRRMTLTFFNTRPFSTPDAGWEGTTFAGE